jgi:hypothetical protein
MNVCPICHSGVVNRSRSRGWWEKCRKAVTGKRPFRCGACAWRGWSVDLGQETGLRSDAPPPEPSGLAATGFARDDRRRDVDFDAIDAFEGRADEKTPPDPPV